MSNNTVTNTAIYRKCLNLQIFELLSTQNNISATAVLKEFAGTHFHICSVDGTMHRVTLFTNKLWDIILLKLTELVHYDSKTRRFDWGVGKEWNVCMSIHTIAECLDLSTTTDALVHLYDRVVAAANVLRNTKITQNNRVIDGYLDFVGVRDCSDRDDGFTKSNAYFCFGINPDLIEYVGYQNPGIYHFNHCWLHLPEAFQNTYAAAKRFGRHYSQNTHNRRYPMPRVTMSVGELRKCLPCLNNKREKANRVSLHDAVKSIPDATYAYMIGKQELTFEELKKLRQQASKYNRIMVAVGFTNHPLTSQNKVTTERIKDMNNDAMYLGRSVWDLDCADDVIDHEGELKRPVNPTGAPPDDAEDEWSDVLPEENGDCSDAEQFDEYEPLYLDDGGVVPYDEQVIYPEVEDCADYPVPEYDAHGAPYSFPFDSPIASQVSPEAENGTMQPDGRIIYPDGRIRLPSGMIIKPVQIAGMQSNKPR